MKLEDVDLYDLDTYGRRGVPHAALRLLREQDPVHWCEEPGGRGFWAITRYQDIVDVSRDPHRFSSARGGTNIKDYEPEDLDAIRLMMLNMDPPQHVKFRRLVRTGFTPRMVALMEPKLRRLVDGILDPIAHLGEIDFVREVACELPLQVIAELLGVPKEDRHQLFDWTNRLIGFDDPEFQTTFEDGKEAAFEVWNYANELAESRRGHEDDDDLVSVLLRAEVDGEQLSEMEFCSFFLLLGVAGNETTRNAISGGLLALIEHPEQYRRLLEDPGLLPSAIEEMLRWVTPVNHFRRTATQDLVLGGKRIKENDKVVMFYASGNRDEAVFTHADRFDVARSPNDHLSFGVGEHFCLGSSLARLEMRIMFEQLLARLPDLQLAGEVRRLRSNFINGIKSMPVRYTPETMSMHASA